MRYPVRTLAPAFALVALTACFNAQVNWDDLGLEAAAATAPIPTPAPAPVRLIFSAGPTAVSVGTCYAYAVSAVGSLQQLLKVTADTTVALSASSGSFYLTAACAATTSSTTLVKGSDFVVVYYKAAAAGAPSLTATDAAGVLAPHTYGLTATLPPKGVFIGSVCAVPGASGAAGTFAGAPNCAFNPGIQGKIFSGLDTGSIYTANNHCQMMAANAGLPNSANYIAWGSMGGLDAYCRVLGLSGTRATNCGQGVLPAGGGPWYKVAAGGGALDLAAPVATNVTQLTSCSPGGAVGGGGTTCLVSGIDRTESGVGMGGFMMTGTYPDGTYYYCDWSTNNGCLVGTSSLDGAWTSYIGAGSDSGHDRQLLCIER